MSKEIPILAISSSVAAGHVGLSAIVPTLNFCGLEAIGLPTVSLSNHPGFGHCAGNRVEVDALQAMLDAHARNGWLAKIETVLTGYLPTAGHVAFARTTIERMRQLNPQLQYICDPVLGDDPKGVYIEAAAASAIRDQLLPLADTLLPNRFELAWLTGHRIETPQDAERAAQLLPPPRVIAKSIPTNDDNLAIIETTAAGTATHTSRKLAGVPNGTGDMLSALITAGWPVARALTALDSVIAASLGQEHLQIVTHAKAWLHEAAPATADTSIAGNNDGFVGGVDGCPAGWIMVAHPVDRPDLAICRIFHKFSELLEATRRFAAVAVDIPIGIPDIATTGGRLADRQARAVLGARQSSVFAVPSRAAMRCTDYRDACATALRHSDPPRKVAKQTFNIFPKMREVDDTMTPELQERVIECHPEVAFWAMNGHQPLTEPKKVRSRSYDPGLALRRGLLVSQGYAREFLEAVQCPARFAAPDDFLDACAAAWTARRLVLGLTGRFPSEPDLDSRGLRMEIVF